MKTLLLALMATLPLSAAAATTLEEETRPAIEHFNLDDGLALEGYDPVAYFPEFGGKAKKGSKKITATHRGVTYRFVSETNREAFLKSPASFEPAYGGWCAWALSDGKGSKVDPDEKSFTIENGQLYLFYDGFLANTRKKWNKAGGAPKLAAKATANWTRIITPPEKLGRRRVITAWPKRPKTVRLNR